VDEDGRRFQNDRDRLLTRHPQRVCLLDLADYVLHSFLNLLYGAALAGPAKVRDSVVDVPFGLWIPPRGYLGATESALQESRLVDFGPP
jgi:hypothetical protein